MEVVRGGQTLWGVRVREALRMASGFWPACWTNGVAIYGDGTWCRYGRVGG